MARGDYSVVAGYNNTSSASTMNHHCGGIILGNNNWCEPASGSNMGICIGHDNSFYQGEGQICIGANNLMKNTIKTNAIVIGYYNEGIKNCIVIGQHSPTTPTLGLNNTKFVVSCGTSAFNKKNALECSVAKSDLTGNNNPIVYINYNFGLSNANSTNKAFVDAITEPQDPSNLTQDDKTLVTKSHLANNLGDYVKSKVSYMEDWDTASALPLDNTTVSLPTTYGTIPTWANRAILTFRWENELITKEIFFDKDEGIHLHVVQRAYSTFPETIHYRHLRVEWDFTNQTLGAKDYWTYDQDMANAGAVSNWDYTLTNASPCKILSVVYSE